MLTLKFAPNILTPIFAPNILTPIFAPNIVTPIFASNMLTPIFAPNILTPIFAPNILTPIFAPHSLTPIFALEPVTGGHKFQGRSTLKFIPITFFRLMRCFLSSSAHLKWISNSAKMKLFKSKIFFSLLLHLRF